MNLEKMIDRIETERLVLFPMTADGLALYNSDPTRFDEEYGATGSAAALYGFPDGFFQTLESMIAADPENYLFFTVFLVVLKASDQIVGGIDFKGVPYNGATEVGYGLSPGCEGRGYMTESLGAFLRLGESLGLKTILAETDASNGKSQNVLKRCGFRLLKQEETLWWEKKLE